MPTRRALCVWLPVALALAGCPAPTGRHRGIIDGSAETCTVVMPMPGATCFTSGEQCVFESACGVGGFTNTTCSCVRASWQCVQDPRCNMPPLDAGPTGCPAGRVHDNDTCGPRQGGNYCAGLTTACDGTSVLDTSCYCTGSRWSCPPPECGSDAGSEAGDVSQVMCPPTAVSGDPCMPGVQCNYPEDACPWVCVCGGDATFSCQFDCGADGGAGDAATFDVSIDP